MRVVKTTDSVIKSPTFVGADGETPTAIAASGVPTVTVTREDGTALAAPTATAVAGQTGVYQITLTAATYTTRCDRLTVTWSGTAGSLAQKFTQTVDVVGGHYCTLPDLRTQPELSNVNKPTGDVLAAMRDEFSDLAESYCGVAFVRSYWRDRLPGNGTDRLLLTRRRPRAVIAATISAVTATGFELSDIGEIIYTGNTWTAPDSTLALNCVIQYEHGWDAPPPEIRRAAILYVRKKALALVATTPNDAISETFDGTQVRYSTPDAKNGRPTGILEVDAILNSLRERLPAVG